MKINRLLKAISFNSVAALVICTSASAANITFNTNAAGTAFTGGGLVRNSQSGAAATLTFTPEANTTVSTMSGINYGIFTLLCAACPLNGAGIGATFDSFEFKLLVTDVTSGGTGFFTGTSNAGTVFRNSSPLVVTWAPIQLGPGTSNAVVPGNFGLNFFRIGSPTIIVAPNSGANDGQTTVQGIVDAGVRPVVDQIPEPVTLGLVGAALIGIVVLRRKS